MKYTIVSYTKTNAQVPNRVKPSKRKCQFALENPFFLEFFMVSVLYGSKGSEYYIKKNFLNVYKCSFEVSLLAFFFCSKHISCLKVCGL